MSLVILDSVKLTMLSITNALCSFNQLYLALNQHMVLKVRKRDPGLLKLGGILILCFKTEMVEMHLFVHWQQSHNFFAAICIHTSFC